jgi:hypothetical protein
MNSEQKYYQHEYGGIYMYLNTVVNKSDNDEKMILYEHVYPFKIRTALNISDPGYII